MALIKRIGTQTEKFQLELTVHSVSVHLEVPCALRIVVKRGQHKYVTQDLRHNLSSGVVFFEKEIKFEATMYKRGQSYQDKNIEFRLVRLIEDKAFKDGKGALSLNEIAATGSQLFREDVPLKGGMDKNAVVCVSLSLAKLEDSESPARSAKHAATQPPVHRDFDRSGLSIDPSHSPPVQESHTPVTAGPAFPSFSPDRKGREWSPVSAQLMETQSPGYSPLKAEAASPASAPLKSILSRQDNKPVLKKSVSLRVEEPVDDGFMKLMKVPDIEEKDEDSLDNDSSSEHEAPKPVIEEKPVVIQRQESSSEEERKRSSRGSSEESKEGSGGKDEERRQWERQVREELERKREVRLGLSRESERTAPVAEFTKGEDTSSDEEPVVVKKDRPIVYSIPSTSLKSSAPNKNSKEAALAAEEKRTGMPVTRERSSACNGCVLQ